MGISAVSIITKMKKELIEAEQTQYDQEVMKRHISRVQLLCDLLLQEKTTVSASQKNGEITTEEMKAMLGNTGANQQEALSNKDRTDINHDEANGNSIFDF